jgi:hypothetical protein
MLRRKWVMAVAIALAVAVSGSLAYVGFTDQAAASCKDADCRAE